MSRGIMKYKDSVTLSTKQATALLLTIWPKAPPNEIYKAAVICQTYGLNPLMKHLFLIPFNEGRPNETWVTVLPITATRLLAARKKPFSYADDSPRIMTEDEQIKYLGEYDHEKIYSITVLQDEYGNQARGYGWWPRSKEVQGGDKGNTKANMAHIRSERQAINRLVPDTLPPDIDVVDERFVKDMSFDPEITEVQPAQLSTGNICPIHNVPFTENKWHKWTHPTDEKKNGKTVWCYKDKVSVQQATTTDEEEEPTPVSSSESSVPPEQPKTKEPIMPYEDFIKEVTGLCRQLGWVEEKDGKKLFTTDLSNLIKDRYPGCSATKDVSEVNRRDLINQLVDRLTEKKDKATQGSMI